MLIHNDDNNETLHSKIHLKNEIKNGLKDGIDLNEEMEDRYIENMMDQSHDEVAFDIKEKKIVGDSAVDEFHKHYKILNKVVDENNSKEQKGSIYTNILSYVDQNN